MPKHLTEIDADSFIATDQLGVAGGVATLDVDGKVPSSQITPSGVTSFNSLTGDVVATAATVGAAPSDTVSRVTGLVANGVTDDGPTIQTLLDTLAVTADHPMEVVVEAPPTGVVYINSTVQVQTDNTTLTFRAPVLFGPSGRVRIFGETVETPSSNKPHLASNATSGTDTLNLANASLFAIGDYIVIRGQRDATGNAFQRMSTTVTNVVGNVLTIADALDSTYQVLYSGSAWPNNYTEVTKVVGSLLTVSAAAGDYTVTVSSTTPFQVGNVVQVLDDSVTHDSDTTTAQSQNYVHREMATILEIVSGTILRLSHELYHSYSTSAHARIVRVAPVVNSQIRGLNATWSSMSTTSAAIEMRYAVNSAIRDCNLTGGSSGSWLNQAFRQSDTLHCITENCRATAPQDTSSGRGYGATLYGSTHSSVTNCRFISTRHSVLLYNGASGNLISKIHSEDCRISDLDCHGAQATKNVFSDCFIKGGSSIPTDGAARKSACKSGNPSHIEGDVQNTFENITCVDIAGAGLEVVSQSTGTVFKNCRVINCNYGIYMAAATNTTLIAHNTRVEDCEFEDIVTSQVYVDGGGSSVVDGLIFDNCRFIRPTGGLNLSNAGRVHVRNCRFYDASFPSTTYAVNASNCPSITVKGNDFSGANRGVKLTTCTNARVTHNIMHDLADTTVIEDAGGSTGFVFRDNDAIGYTPISRFSGSGPSASGIISLLRPYVTDTPSDHGFLEWNVPWGQVASGTGQVAVDKTLYVMKVEPRTGLPISTVNLWIGTPGSGLTSGQCLVGYYDDTGTRLAVSGDQSANWTSTGLKPVSLGASIPQMAGRFYYVGLLANGTTPPSFIRAISSVSAPNANQTNANQWFSTQGTAVTAMPSSLTLSSNSGTGAQAYLVALS